MIVVHREENPVDRVGGETVGVACGHLKRNIGDAVGRDAELPDIFALLETHIHRRRVRRYSRDEPESLGVSFEQRVALDRGGAHGSIAIDNRHGELQR